MPLITGEVSEPSSNYTGHILKIGLLTLASIGIEYYISRFAFPSGVRSRILERDNYRSVVSGRDIHEARLEVAHFTHNKKDPRYNMMENGRTLTISEHYIEHVDRGGNNGLTYDGNMYALSMIWLRMNVVEREEVLMSGYYPPDHYLI